MKATITISALKGGVSISTIDEDSNIVLKLESVNIYNNKTLLDSIEIELEDEDLIRFFILAVKPGKRTLSENSVKLNKFFTNAFSQLLEPGQFVELKTLGFLGVQCPYCGAHVARYIVKLPHVFGETTTMYCARCFEIVSRVLPNSKQRKEV
jgi:hypothetical protein